MRIPYYPSIIDEFFILKTFTINFVIGYVFGVGMYTTAVQLVDLYQTL